MRIKNIENENLDESIQPGDIVSFEFEDELAVEGLVVETEQGLEIQLDEEGEEYLTELLPLAIGAAGAAWTAYDAYKAAQQLQRGEITQADLAKQVGTDAALTLAGGGVAKLANKGFKAFRKWYKGNQNTPDTQRKEPTLTRRDKNRGSNLSSTSVSSTGADLDGFLKNYGPLSQMSEETKRLCELAGLNEEKQQLNEFLNIAAAAATGAYNGYQIYNMVKDAYEDGSMSRDEAGDILGKLALAAGETALVGSGLGLLGKAGQGVMNIGKVFKQMPADTMKQAGTGLLRGATQGATDLAAELGRTGVAGAVGGAALASQDDGAVGDAVSQGVNTALDTAVDTGVDIYQNIRNRNQANEEVDRLRELAGLTEGTWAVPNTMELAKKLEAVMANPIPAKDASDVMYSLIGDDELFDSLYDLETDDPSADARPTIARWIEANRKLLDFNTDDKEVMSVIDKIAGINKEQVEEATYKVEIDGGIETVTARTEKEAIHKAARKQGNSKSVGKSFGPKAKVTKVDEAEYQGKKVTLNKPIRTGKDEPKKFKVYVKDGDKVKLVRFGHQGKGNEKTMTIKKSDPKRRKSFRARHNCDNPGPKTKARYWSCKAW